ncbi:YCF48-related protein [Emticicia sp. C21]|uniref:WD40/YVTN/BNR-like repeat-containing protein n=1 Tax=Emticicia sp. C21 TaxID=2302915 RepID=UPI000E34181C|nr:YCF48-related protein [Emticicia sp. C21]RFS18281.1 hypothetical protein D0T08_03265 [Emticicia sp. C21]
MTNLNKKASLLLLLSFCTFFTNGQSWIWQRPIPQGNTLTDVFLLNQNHGWAVGMYGTVVKTTDGGLTWSVLNNTISIHLNAVHFINESTGIIVGSNKIYRTTNGGVNWVEIYSPSGESLVDVFFVNSTTGWISGGYGTLLKTTNGGVSWSSVQTNSYNGLSKIHFANENEGIIMLHPGRIIKTVDGGNTWETKLVRENTSFFHSEFINAHTGWVSFGGGGMARTNDAGNNWMFLEVHPSYQVTSFHFSDSQNGIAFLEYGAAGKTTDGGNTWSFFRPTYSIGDYFAFNGNRGVSVGYDGRICLSIDNGNNWQTIVAPTINSGFYDIDFKDNNTGWAVGTSIYKTTNGGSTWTQSNNSGVYNFNDICLTPQHTLFAAGYDGKIIKSTNGGTSWSVLTTNTTQELLGIFFINENTGWCVGHNGTILKTINGGQTWNPQNSGDTKYLYKVKFINENTGWIVGGRDVILKTTDGGNNWIPQNTNTGDYYYNLFIKDESTIFATGHNTLLRTTDGGVSWNKQNLNFPYYNLRNVYFWDSNNGMVVGEESFFRTTDGGNTWTKQYLKISGDFWAIKFTDASHGWIASSSGSILKYWNGEISINQQSVSICPNTPITLSIEDCPGTVTWSNGMTGNNISFIPTPGVYTAHCSSGGSKSCTVSVAETNLSINEPLRSISRDFQAADYIQSQSQIGTNISDDRTRVKFQSGKAIILDAGFKVNNYAIFTAEIKSCSN